MRERKLWEKSTGPKTPEGKRAAAQNAYKHGFRSAEMKKLIHVLHRQRMFVKAALARHNLENMLD